MSLRSEIRAIIAEHMASAGVCCGEPVCQPCEDQADRTMAAIEAAVSPELRELCAAAIAERDAIEKCRKSVSDVHYSRAHAAWAAADRNLRAKSRAFARTQETT